MKRLAYMNGHKTTACKANGRWMVGGDFDTRGSITIASKDREGTWAWYKLMGCRLKFDDFMVEAEIAEQMALGV
jgi:hypothetical protein